jgi:hypothetical protein
MLLTAFLLLAVDLILSHPKLVDSLEHTTIYCIQEVMIEPSVRGI